MARQYLCTNAQALQTARVQDEDEVGGTDVVTEAVEEATIEVTNDYGDPPRKSTFILDSTQTKYEFRRDKRRTYRVDLVIIRDDDNDRFVYTSGSSASHGGQTYVEDLEYNTITFSSETVSAYDGQRVEVHYVPYELHQLARIKSALFLLENTAVLNSDETGPTIISRLANRAKRIEEGLVPVAAVGSEDEKRYDPTYGEYIPQRRFYTY